MHSDPMLHVHIRKMYTVVSVWSDNFVWTQQHGDIKMM